MDWKIELTPDVRKNLKKFDTASVKRILKFLDRLNKLDNPRDIGKPLTGLFSGLWRYRVGDYRILCRIEDENICVLVIYIGHRKQVYKR
ncbi:MAG: type II toxin-antitoxin system RelE/ParE family toxin [Desulfobacteraceae bacterium]|nr:type II toxin-antitoxin system RelE/ParE family toxin [Desulfobacteraceae bacterium]